MPLELVGIIVGAFATVGVGLLTVWSMRQDQTRNRQWEEHDRTKSKVENLENRLGTVEADLRHLPTKDSIDAKFSGLYEKINDIRSALSELKGTQDAILEVFRGPGKTVPRKK